jgi:hypothetical protein
VKGKLGGVLQLKKSLYLRFSHSMQPSAASSQLSGRQGSNPLKNKIAARPELPRAAEKT